MKNIGQLMKQAQMMQSNLKKAQDDVRALVVEGVASAGIVKILLGGDKIVKKINIEPGLLKEAIEDKALLEDMITVAINDALQKLEIAEKERMSAVTAGMPIPPGMRF